MRYWPTEAGDYAVHVVCDDEDIKDSPFMAHILPAANDVFPEKVIPTHCIIYQFIQVNKGRLQLLNDHILKNYIKTIKCCR